MIDKNLGLTSHTYTHGHWEMKGLVVHASFINHHLHLCSGFAVGTIAAALESLEMNAPLAVLYVINLGTD